LQCNLIATSVRAAIAAAGDQSVAPESRVRRSVRRGRSTWSPGVPPSDPTSLVVVTSGDDGTGGSGWGERSPDEAFGAVDFCGIGTS